MLTKLKLYFIRANIKALTKQRNELLDAIPRTRAGVAYIEEEIRREQAKADKITAAAP